MILAPVNLLVDALPLSNAVVDGCTFSIFMTEDDRVICLWVASGLFSWFYLFSFWLFLFPSRIVETTFKA